MGGVWLKVTNKRGCLSGGQGTKRHGKKTLINIKHCTKAISMAIRNTMHCTLAIAQKKKEKDYIHPGQFGI
jgi:hypothetical protein